MLADLNAQVYGTLRGASGFTVTGTLRDADVTPRLPELDLPVMLAAGEHDEARPATVRQQADLMRSATYFEVAGASHLPQLERPGAYWPAVRRLFVASEWPQRATTKRSQVPVMHSNSREIVYGGADGWGWRRRGEQPRDAAPPWPGGTGRAHRCGDRVLVRAA